MPRKVNVNMGTSKSKRHTSRESQIGLCPGDLLDVFYFSFDVNLWAILNRKANQIIMLNKVAFSFLQLID